MLYFSDRKIDRLQVKRRADHFIVLCIGIHCVRARIYLCLLVILCIEAYGLAFSGREKRFIRNWPPSAYPSRFPIRFSQKQRSAKQRLGKAGGCKKRLHWELALILRASVWNFRPCRFHVGGRFLRPIAHSIAGVLPFFMTPNFFLYGLCGPNKDSSKLTYFLWKFPISHHYQLWT